MRPIITLGSASLIAAVALSGGCLMLPSRIKSGQPKVDAKDTITSRDVTPAPSGGYLRNPQSGWVVYCNEGFDQARQGAPGNPLAPANVVIVRAPLRDWEPEENKFDTAPAVAVMDSWASRRPVGIRIDCSRADDLPDAAKSVVPLFDEAEGKPPVYSDAEYTNLHRRAGARLAPRPPRPHPPQNSGAGGGFAPRPAPPASETRPPAPR